MTEQAFGVQGTRQGQVFFTEQTIPDAVFVKHISIKSARHNSNLTEIKGRMAGEAFAAGASAVMNFRYGQKKKGLVRLWDSTGWYGEGDAVQVADGSEPT